MADLNEINDLANDVLVGRLEIEAVETEIEALLLGFEKYQELIKKLGEARALKEAAQDKLLNLMTEADLKGWKTDYATFSRAERKTVVLDSNFKKAVESAVKRGEAVEGFKLVSSNYISVRIIPKS